MKRIKNFLVLIILICAIQLNAQESKQKKALFTEQDIHAYQTKLRDASVNADSIFKIKDGIILIKGNPFGYIRTKEKYSNYHLSLEWRWPEEASNSGVFIHIQLPDTVFPECIEVQLKANNAGDFICAGGSDMKERIDKTKKVVAKINNSNEVALGEWNKMEVTCMNNTIQVIINGILQNKASETSITNGYIGLQSEGKAIEFRNINITK